MAKAVQRLRYFDGEYLRSSDFTDEQSYHVAMRRLMNLKLHLHGIVYGLELVEDADSVPTGPWFYSVAAGMAIDQSGREIIVPAPYSLTNLLNGPGLSPGLYEVWICYQENETGLPAAGYLDCNVQNQSTRWAESFKVQLKPVSGPSLFVDCGGVRLGAVRLEEAILGLQVVKPAYNSERTYVGIRAQRVIAPGAQADTFDITAQATPLPDKALPGYLDVHPGTFNRGNVVVKKNLVVGDDFILNSTDPSKSGYSANLPSFDPAPTGDVKVSKDLFLQGNFYGFNAKSNQWYGLQQYIQSLMPSIVINTAPVSINVSPQAADIDSGQSATISVVSPIVTSVTPQVMLSIAGIQWLDSGELASDFASSGTQVAASVTLASIAPSSPGSTTWNLVISWNVSPNVKSGSSYLYPVASLQVNYIVVFTPPPP